MSADGEMIFFIICFSDPGERGTVDCKMGQGLVIRSLNILLGLFFMFLGSLKITPNIIRDLHKDLRSEYAKYAKVG